MRRKIIVNDPIHKVMSFGSDDNVRTILKGVIDTPEFQRLRRVSQLGLASYVFPGATHSRFCHSLGAAYLAKVVLDHLRDTDEDRSVNSQLDRHEVPVLLAALLHDVGHGPFSHSFENVLGGLEEVTNFAPLHEEWTADIITNKNSNIKKVLENNKINPKVVASVFEEKSDASLPLYLKQIVSSQLDVDRMDYLLRDSHFAGVSVGEFDVHYLINCLTVINHNKQKVRTLGLTKKGVKAYESYAMARQLMNRSVYYHRRVKVLEFMMEEFLRGVIRNGKKLQGIRSLTNLIPKYILAVASELGTSVKTLTKSEFIKKNRDAYVELTETDVWTLVSAINRTFDQRIPKSLNDLAARLLARQPLAHQMIQAGKDGLLRSLLIDKGFKHEIDFVIVDLSSTIYKKTSDKVFVIDDDKKPSLEVTNHSELISAFHDKAETESLLILIDPTKQRLFEHAKNLNAIPKSRSVKIGR